MDKYRADVYTKAGQIYEMVFGYRALPFPTAIRPDMLKVDMGEKMSKLGAAIYKNGKNGQEFCPVTLAHMAMGKVVKNYDLPYSTISMTMEKNIESTPLIARRGSVHELISVDDYRFTIQGVLMTDDEEEDGLPQDALDELRTLWEITEPVKLKNAFAEIFLQSDNSVIILSIEFPDMKGITGAQAYTITLKSDIVLELEDE